MIRMTPPWLSIQQKLKRTPNKVCKITKADPTEVQSEFHIVSG